MKSNIISMINETMIGSHSLSVPASKLAAAIISTENTLNHYGAGDESVAAIKYIHKGISASHSTSAHVLSTPARENTAPVSSFPAPVRSNGSSARSFPGPACTNSTLAYIFTALTDSGTLPVCATNGLVIADTPLAFANGTLARANGTLACANGNLARANGILARANGPLACANGDLACANGPLARANGRLAHANGPLACTNGILARANGPLARANGILAHANRPLARANGRLARPNGDLARTVIFSLRTYKAIYKEYIILTKIKANKLKSKIHQFDKEIGYESIWLRYLIFFRVCVNRFAES